VWKPRRHTNLWTSTSCHGNNFTFFTFGSGEWRKEPFNEPDPNFHFSEFRDEVVKASATKLTEVDSNISLRVFLLSPLRKMPVSTSNEDRTYCFLSTRSHTESKQKIALLMPLSLQIQILQHIPCDDSGYYPSCCLLFRTQCFGDWILSPSSGGTYSVGPNT
jgi:hypothetical protein